MDARVVGMLVVAVGVLVAVLDAATSVAVLVAIFFRLDARFQLPSDVLLLEFAWCKPQPPFTRPTLAVPPLIGCLSRMHDS